MLELAAVVALLVVVPVLSLGVLASASRRVARRTGRSTGSVILAASWIFIVVVAAEIGALYAIPFTRERLNAPTDAGPVAITGLVVGGLGLAMAVAGVIVSRALPPARRFPGERRSRKPYRLFVGCAWVGSIAGPIVILALDLGWEAALRLLSVGVPLAGYLSYQRRRARARDAREEMENDRRPPVLYLRPFLQDVDLYAEQSRTWKQTLRGYFRGDDEPSEYVLTFEEFFGDSFRAGLGPFVALGNPTDRLAPLGASRLYLHDDSWQAQFLDLLTSSTCVVGTTRRSEGTEWELQLIIRQGCLPKFFILTAPATEVHRWREKLSNWLQRLFLATRQLDKIWNPPVEQWPNTVAEFGKLGLRLPAADPGPGAVLSFDRSGAAQSLLSGACTPDQYVAAIRAKLAA